MRPEPFSSPTFKKPLDGNKFPAPPALSSLFSTFTPEITNLGSVCTREALRVHALPRNLVPSILRILSTDRPNLPPATSPAPDLSPIRWKLKLQVPSTTRTSVVDGLCDDGAHGEFLAKDVAQRL